MATKDPNSRLPEGNAGSPYRSPYATPNGAVEQPPVAGTSPLSPGTNLGTEHEETAGEKIGRFFRRAMDRLSSRDVEWGRGNERNRRDRDTEERDRKGDPFWQSGRSALRDRGQGESRDLNDRAEGPSWRGPVGERGATQGQWRAGSRGGPTLGEQALGHSPSDTEGLAGMPRELGGDRGFDEGYRRDEWNRREQRRAERSARRGFRDPYAGVGLGADEDRSRELDEGLSDLDRDRGQGRRFWQREPLAARDVMTRMPKTVTRGSALREAAVIMRDENCGVVPVVDSDGRLQGILTDRDIVVRGLVGESGQLSIEEVMTDDVSAVTEDEPLTSVLDLMGRKQVRRVPVVDRDDRLLGIISMADIANRADYDEDLQDAFERISSRRSFWSLFS
jgi:CBS domain-containing protein